MKPLLWKCLSEGGGCNDIFSDRIPVHRYSTIDGEKKKELVTIRVPNLNATIGTIVVKMYIFQ